MFIDKYGRQHPEMPDPKKRNTSENRKVAKAIQEYNVYKKEKRQAFNKQWAYNSPFSKRWR